ncbi:MAG: bifunctional pyr operon transcriptional regulator/uracil phosphoribosyltransferase PyrR [Clostridia bacterium]|nr:bifunctional pyr operon transcriptional regulator/uracil phosphoribosyltransferase PyrR [Clostridia bacterium]MBQ9482137.1 bifunctional pyr operon transcriptional regulator/uracil phosphoribosyltransferase PyrR [Clostridia bacterium]
MKFKATILDETAVKRAMTRISFEIIERVNTENAVLVGIKTRGVPLAETIRANVKASSGVDLPICELDITHFRDDVRPEVKVSPEQISVPVEGKDVILVDDVLFTGRTTRAAIEAIMDAGRANTIRLAVLVDRGHRELPIRADFVGKNVPTSIKEEIVVHLSETDGETSVSIYEK